MKIREGFVSNSSSTSFCIYGAPISYRDMDKVEEWMETCGLNKIFVVKCTDDDAAYVGREFKTIGDEETGAAFKKNVVDVLEKMSRELDIGREYCSVHELSWYNG